MKKSKMISILTQYLNSEELAKLTLTVLENHGMEPPKIPVKLIHPNLSNYGTMCTMRCNCESCNPEFLVNKWELE